MNKRVMIDTSKPLVSVTYGEKTDRETDVTVTLYPSGLFFTNEHGTFAIDSLYEIDTIENAKPVFTAWHRLLIQWLTDQYAALLAAGLPEDEYEQKREAASQANSEMFLEFCRVNRQWWARYNAREPVVDAPASERSDSPHEARQLSLFEEAV